MLPPDLTPKLLFDFRKCKTLEFPNYVMATRMESRDEVGANLPGPSNLPMSWASSTMVSNSPEELDLQLPHGYGLPHRIHVHVARGSARRHVSRHSAFGAMRF
jgi:hypothetical protein